MGKVFLAVIAMVIFIAFIGTVCSDKDRADEAKKLKEEQDHKRLAGKEEL